MVNRSSEGQLHSGPVDEAGESHHVFISYASEDEGFARRLQAAFETRGREAWVAWEDIPAASLFWRDIENAIETADAVVFVISPDSVRSENCARELDRAAANAKRLVPLEIRETDPEEAPPAVRSLQWIWLTLDADFDAVVGSAIDAVETDLEWVRKQTELQRSANVWERNDKRRFDLARGERLTEAEALLTEGRGQDPPLTKL